MEVGIAAAEVGNNILDHAGRGRDLRIRMQVQVPGDHVRIEFIDDGLPADMDLASIRMPDEMAESGRGLALARASLRDLTYRRDPAGNRWTLVSHRFD
jgi:serine/threonine-protein kinase RsbW